MHEVREYWRRTPGKKDHLVHAHERNRPILDKPYKTSKTGVTGIMWDKRTKSWKVALWRNKEHIWLGRYKDIEQAKTILTAFNLTGTRPYPNIESIPQMVKPNEYPRISNQTSP